MRLRLLWAYAVIARTAYAVQGPTGAINSTTPTATDGNITIHYITVGKDENEFVPNSIVANVGDVVSFQFYPLNHSVIRSAYGWPCIPVEDSPSPATPFFSGFHPLEEALSSPPTWNLTVNTTEPIWFYCGAPGSCIDWGMLGVINADAQTSIATQIELARKAKIMLLPGQQFPSEQAEASVSRLAHSATTTLTKTITSKPSMTTGESASMSMTMQMDQDRSHGPSTGEVVGIAVGVGATALILAGFFFLIYRTRHLKQKLERERAAARQSTWDSPGAHDFRASPGGVRHLSKMSPILAQNFSPVPYREIRFPSWPAVGAQTGPQASPSSCYNEERYSKPLSPSTSSRQYELNSGLEVQVAELDASKYSIHNR